MDEHLLNGKTVNLSFS